ncbi:hypothetical protein BDW62DRAFT_197278 [Aspergillus aurantiobrunneus]
MQISAYIQRQIVSSLATPELDHIRALNILGLLHLGLGNVSCAWVLIGQATRMLALLPESSKSGRYSNTFHGCVFLDTVTSALVDRPPSLSDWEHSSLGSVNEDDIEEWDSWSIVPAAPRGPLHALSTFSKLQELVRSLSKALYHEPDYCDAQKLFLGTLEKNKTILASRPYPGRDSATPPLPSLHLTSTFVVLSTIRHFKLYTLESELISTSHRMVDLLDDYADLTKSTKSSPLLRGFAMQCQHCLDSQGSRTKYVEIMSLRSRVSMYMQDSASTKPFASSRVPDDTVSPTSIENYRPPEDDMGARIPHDGTPSQLPLIGLGTNSDIVSIPYATPISNSESLSYTTPDHPNPPPLPEDTDGFDALFEELVMSIPNQRLEPEFAHNLGFYAGDLDTDFMTQLRRPPNG